MGNSHLRTVELAANTHPEVVKALVQLCLEAGAKQVRIFDRTCNDERRCYMQSGIRPAVESIRSDRVSIEYIDRRSFKELAINGGRAFDRWEFYLPVIEADATQIRQVVMNLVKNAVDALVELNNGGRELVIGTATVGRDRVEVSVRDSGSGIPAAQADRIFDAFFTTKPPGSGTGLGLDISYGIVVDIHGGELTVDSEPGRTVFRVVVPRHRSV
mgnify:CR=1 FL=1